MTKITEVLESKLNSHINKIIKVLKEPTIYSNLPSIRKCAEIYCKYLEEAGFKKAMLIETDGSPLVYGEHLNNASKTVLVYNFFDMLPSINEDYVFESDVKNIEPFGKCITGRGIRTKAAGVAFINAIESWTKAVGKLPVNIKFIAEGEEMYGSPHLPWFIEKYRELLTDVDAVYFPSLSQNSKGQVESIYLGGKGFVGFEIVSSGKDWGRGPIDHNIHSSTRSIVDNPMWRLVEAIKTFVDNNGQKILIDNFYENVQSPTDEERELIKNLSKKFDMEALKKRLSVNKFSHDVDVIDTLTKYLFDPTLNIDGIPDTSISPVGEVSHVATAKFQSRIVPNQTVDGVLSKIRSHLDKLGYFDIKIRKLYGFNPGRTKFQEPIIQAILKLYRNEGLESPAIYPSSPASPPVNAFNHALNIPCGSGGLGHFSSAKKGYLVLNDYGKIAGLVRSERSFIEILKNYSFS
jgi:acetylornithine deacetylase/succinyl-diaminopimelate desuccinylase-like protein